MGESPVQATRVSSLHLRHRLAISGGPGRLRRSLRIALLVPLLWAAMATGARAAGLEFVETHVDGAGGVDGLGGAEAMAISPGDEFVYVAGSNEDAIAIMRRDRTTGSLTFVGTVFDDQGGVDGLNEVQGLAISPDGANLYAVAHTDGAVAVFARDEDTGLLSFLEVKKDGVGGITKLAGAMGVSVSPDGRHVYVASNVNDAVVVFSRNGSTGRLTLVEELSDGAGGITSLDGAEALTVSPDGAHVYVAAEDDDAITVFARNSASGSLTLVEVKQEGGGGMHALDRVQAVAVSADGANLYAASGLDNAVVVFARNEETGVLSLLEEHRDGAGLNGLAGAEWVAVSPNGAYVYAVGDMDDSLVVFRRDGGTGRLTYVETHKDGLGGVGGLNDVEAVAVTSDSTSVYTVSDVDNAISAFANLCGNGRFDTGEACDDGNTQNGDCCTAACTIVSAGSACPDDGNVCTNDVCNGAGLCLHVNNTVACDDGAFCTVADTCQSGVCQGTARDCSGAGDQCNAGVCDEANDRCTAQPRTAGTTCNDGNACTQVDTCQAGVCVGASPVVCTVLDQCHVAGTCNPTTGLCSNPEKPSGTACNDGNACTQVDTCQVGACVGASPVVCTAQDQCHVAGTCNPATGVCSNPEKANGSACTDGNACTQTDTCQAGACVGASPVVCAAQDQCHVAGTCNPATGVCSNPEKANGSACADGSACTQADTCQAGACVGASPVVCAAQDQCHVAGTCNPATGVCSNPLKANWAPCSDGDACTRMDACLAGVCVGADPVLCAPLDQCHVAGVCDPATGLCSNPAKPDETVMAFVADADAYTDSSMPTTNLGAASTLRVDESPDRRVYLRFTASGISGRAVEAVMVRLYATSDSTAGSDQGGDLHAVGRGGWGERTITHANRPALDGEVLASAGSVEPSQAVEFDVTGFVVEDGTYEFAIAGVSENVTIYRSREAATNHPELVVFLASACDDGDACTQWDTCLGGTCMGADPVVCTAADQCHAAGECNPTTGTCSNPEMPDGFGCDDGDGCTQSDTCLVGACVGADPVVCTAADQCHAAGECNPATGACSDPALANGAVCDDGDACTRVDECRAGICTGSNAIVCAPTDGCHVVGVCNPATGLCSNPAAADGAACDDGNACTRVDACSGGICRGANRVVCEAGQCHGAGVCDPASGRCVSESRADGTVCDDGDVCTRGDICSGGRCVGTATPDSDGDGTCDAADVCPDFPDAGQWDTDGDGIGDACQCNLPIPGRCIAGGGSTRTDCFLELITHGAVRYNRKHTKIKYVVQCYDGQAECDADGARDGQCTFTVGLCFGNADPRFPRCNPEDVMGLEVVSPNASSAASIGGRSNAKRLEDAIAALGLEVRRRGETIAQSVAPMGEGICGPAITLVTPAPEFGKKVVRRKFKIRARGANGRIDTDRFVLVCR